jgi:hypothetical protein
MGEFLSAPIKDKFSEDTETTTVIINYDKQIYNF